MKKLTVVITIITICLLAAGCMEESQKQGAIGWQETPEQISVPDLSWNETLEEIAVPDMSASILDSSETDQLKWLADIYEFEIKTMQSKTSDLTKNDLLLVESHLSQVFGSEESNLLIDGFYQYNEENQTYYVPDGGWFSYNEWWPSSSLTTVERSDRSVTLQLTGVDEYGGDEREIQYLFSLEEGRLLLEKRTLVK